MRRVHPGAVEAGGTGIDGDERARQVHDDRVVAKEHPLFAGRGPEPHRDLPSAAVVEAVIAEGALGEGAPAVVDGGLDQRKPAPEDPVVHEVADRLPGGRLECRPEVLVVGVPPEVVGQVATHSVPERLLAEELFQHPHHRRALLVGEHVEHGLGVCRGHHRILDGPRGGQGVHVQRRCPCSSEAGPHVPVGPPGLHRLHLHEGGKGLVQPDAVPPAHGDQVAEPEVGQLVAQDRRHALQLPLVGRLRVDQQKHLTERYATQVLHGPEGEVRECNQVDLASRDVDAVPVG